jgi:hypothetical protein
VSCGRLTHPLRERPQAADCVVQSGHEHGPRTSAERCRRVTRDARRGLGRARCRARRKGAARRPAIAQAIRYGFNHWERLLRFLNDGRIEIDSNTVERSMRPVALNRKNALFAGSDEGAENSAMLASLIETCKLHGINPHACLTDVLTKLVNNWPNLRLG